MLTPAQQEVVFGMVLYPALAAGLALLVGWAVGKRHGTPGELAVAAPLALGGAFAAAQLALVGTKGWWPIDAEGWLMHAAVATALLGALEALWRLPAWVRWPLRGLLCGALATLVLTTVRQYHLEGAAGWLWTGAMAAASLACWGSLEQLAERRPARSVLLCLGLVVGACAGLLGELGHYAIGAERLGALGIAIGMLFLVTLKFPDLSLRGAAPAVALLLVGLLARGRWSADVTTPAVALVLVAAAGAPWWAAPKERPWVLRLVMAVITIGLLCGASVMISTPSGAGQPEAGDSPSSDPAPDDPDQSYDPYAEDDGGDGGEEDKLPY